MLGRGRKQKKARIIHELQKTVENKLWTADHEKFLYKMDVGDLPKIVPSVVFNLDPMAIVQPQNKEQLKEIVQIASRENVPIVPRGAGTSGYGGVLPIKGGIIIDFRGLNNVIEINHEALTVTTEPGITWTKLEEELRKSGLTLLSYPSSAPGATVGGWIAQGGAGIGSAKYGGVEEQIIETEMIIPSGIYKTKDWEEVVGAEGITGLISQVKLRVKKASNEQSYLFLHPDIEKLISILEEIVKLDPYHIKLEDAGMTDLRAMVTPEMGSLGGNSTLQVIFEKTSDQLDEKIKRISKEYDIQLATTEQAEHEWEEKFYPIRFKRQGPSLIIAEAMIPVSSLGPAVKRIREKLSRESFGIELILSKDECVAIGWFLDDDRKRFYLFRWYKSFAFLYAAKKFGARPYATGIWFAGWGKEAMGSRLKKIKQIRKRNDPHGILNPGKVYGAKAPKYLPIFPMGIGMRLGRPFLGLAYWFVSRSPF